MINMQAISHPRASKGIEDAAAEQPELVLEEEFRLGTRENVAFSVLLIMSFYAALEGTSIGVALPVSHPTRHPILNIHGNK